KAPGSPRHVIFDHGMRASIEQRMVLERDLARALERGELHVDYQPVVSLRSGRVWGFEALARWRHPVRGMVDAADFIPLAEQTGQVVAIDLWVLREACEQAARWKRIRPEAPMRISVNLSGKELLRTDLAEQVRGVLEQTGADATGLTLELPEAVFAERAESAGVMLQQLGLMNVHLQIDGFGSARSALHHLTHLPVARLKLAPSFSDPARRGGDVVRAMVSMAHSLDLRVVANGVETREQLERMRALDCDYAQGFALSPAVPAAAAQALLVADDPFGVAAAWSPRGPARGA
ncbi:MAG TPA: EAL domain-containing protein, partial [Longimicrobium sp.]